MRLRPGGRLTQTGASAMNKTLPTNLVVIFVLAAWSVWLFWPANSFDFINMDDDVYVTANAHVLSGLSWANVEWSFVGLKAGFWHPFTWLSYLLDVTVWGTGPGGFHRTNIFLHAANGALVFLLLRRLTGSLWRSALVAALFAVHPLRVEPVAWVGMRKELLGAFFGLLALVFYADYARAKTMGRRSPANYWLSFFFFACGLLSKPMVVTLPLAMLLLDAWPLSRFSVSNFQAEIGKLVWEKLPFLAAAAVVSVVTLFGDFHWIDPGEMITPVIQHSLGLRLENAVLSYVRYLAMTFWPVNLTPLYLYPVGYPFWLVTGAAVLLLAVSVVAFVVRHPCWRLGWAWYLVTLLPVIGLIQVGPHTHADRYVYLPLIGIFIALVWGLAQWLEQRRASRALVAGVAVLVLAAGSLRTRDQLMYWRNSGSLFAHTAAVTQDNYIAYALCGHYCAAKGLTDMAIENFVKSIEINPRYADAWNNLGLAVAAKGRQAEAMADYRRAIEINPGHVGALNNLGGALAATGKVEEAMDCYQRALKTNPNQAETLNNLGYLLSGQGRSTDAIPYYTSAVRVRPQESGFRMNLAAALMSSGRQEEGLAQYREVLRQNPELKQVRDYLEAVKSAGK